MLTEAPGSRFPEGLARLDSTGQGQVLRQIQRHAGNAAVGRMLASQSPLARQPTAAPPATAPPAAQDDAKDDAWKRVEGDRLIDQVKAGVAEWVSFRKQPRTGQTPLPGGQADTVIREFAEKFRLDPDAAKLKAKAIQKLGSRDLKYLEEMASIWGAAGFEGTDVVFGVTRSDPQHTYILKTASSGSLDLAQKVLKFIKLESFVEVKYANKFGWAWTKQLGLVGISLGVSLKVSYQKGLETPFDPAKSEKNPKTGDVKPGYKVPVQPFSVDIEGSATADPVNRFWGMDDLAGVVTSVSGPGAKAEVAGLAGGKFRFGVAIVFHGQIPGELSFPQLDGSLKSTLERQADKFKADAKKMGESVKDISFEVNLVSGGIAYAFVEHKPEAFDVKDLKKRLAPDSASWTAEVAGFETGQATVTPGGKGSIDGLKRQTEERKKQMLEQANDLTELGVNPEMNWMLDFKLVGHASRIWRGAGNEADRKLNNDALAGARADAVGREIEAAFPGNKTVSVSSAGAGAMSGSRAAGWDYPAGADQPPVWDPGQQDRPMSDEEAEARYKEEVERAKQEFPNPKDQKVRLKQIEERFGKGSNEGAIRKVEIAVEWKGKKVEYESGGFGTPPELPAP